MMSDMYPCLGRRNSLVLIHPRDRTIRQHHEYLDSDMAKSGHQRAWAQPILRSRARSGCLDFEEEKEDNAPRSLKVLR